MLESIAPAAGPIEGGTLVRVYGSHLHGGPLAARAVTAAGVAYSTSRLCRFGDGTEPVPASHDAAHGALTLALALTLTPTPTLTLTLTPPQSYPGALLCRTPADAALAPAGALPVSVALNAEHFTAQQAPT